MRSIITRFAPSPTGLLHVGNIRTALVNWLFTKKNNGKFLLRIDDTDLERSEIKFENQIKQDLLWLNLNWDYCFNQSSRLNFYEEAKQKLINEGRLYPCFETKEELDMKRKMLLNRGLPPIYDRSALKMTEKEKDQLIAQGKKPHYRFLLKDEDIIWHDLVRGEISFKARNLSDPILIREDGSMTYMISSVVDDIDYNITHVIRGEDHITNTAISIQLCQALGGIVPTFGHLSLLNSKSGSISKRTGGFDISSIREQNIDYITILSLLARLGTSKPVEPINNIELLIDTFDLSYFGRATANYDYSELERLNHKIVSNLSYSDGQTRLNKLPVPIDENFWNAVRPNLNKINEIEEWYNICNSPITPIISDKNLLDLAINCLPEGDWDNNTWNIWINNIQSHTDKKGKDLFKPIRLALTGKEAGPELKSLLPLIGIDKTIKRLSGIAA